MITLESYPIPNSHVVGRILDDEAVLVMPEQGQVKVLSEVGARIWALADGTRTVGDIVGAICTEYDVTPADAEVDILDFLTELRKREIVSIEGEPRAASSESSSTSV